MNYKDNKPYMSAFFKLTCKQCGILFNRFYRLEIRSLMVGIFDPACELLPPWTKELYLCTVATLLYLLSDLLPPPPLLKQNVQYKQSVWLGGGGGEGAVLQIRIRIRIHMFVGLPDPDPDPSIIMQK